MVDGAIISHATANSSRRRARSVSGGDFGVYTQQFPYPCFMRDK